LKCAQAKIGAALRLSSLALHPLSVFRFLSLSKLFLLSSFRPLLECDGEPVKREDEEKLDEVSLRAQPQLAPAALSAFTVCRAFHAIRPATQTQTYVIPVFALCPCCFRLATMISAVCASSWP